MKSGGWLRGRGSILLVLVVAVGVVACGAGTQKPPDTPPSGNRLVTPASGGGGTGGAGGTGAATGTVEPDHFELKRRSFEVTLSATPAVRFRCMLRHAGVERTIEWDPEAPDGNSRRVRLFAEAKQLPAGSFPEIVCGSEVLKIDQGEGAVKLVQYVEVSEKTADGVLEIGHALREVDTKPPAEGDKTEASLKVKVKQIGNGTVTLKDIVGNEVPVASTRSLDPLTPVVADLAMVMAAVAIERAKSAGAKLINRNLTSRFCLQLTEKNFADTKLGEQLKLAATDTPLFPTTCDLLRTTNVEVLAAMPRMLARALTADLAALLLRTLKVESNPLPPEIRRTIVPVIQSAIAAAIEGRAILTERDAQIVLLQMAQIGVCRKGAPPSVDCLARVVVEAGLALVAECVQEGQCTADDLQARLLREAACEESKDCRLRLALQKWPDLVGILARAVDVFKPPKGTSAKLTAKLALNTTIDLIALLASGEIEASLEAARAHDQGKQLYTTQEALTTACADNSDATFAKIRAALGGDLCSWTKVEDEATKAEGRKEAFERLQAAMKQPRIVAQQTTFLESLKMLRELVNAVGDDEPERAARAAGAFLANIIADAVRKHCGEVDSCKDVAINPANVRKSFRILNAILAYASSYRPPVDGSPDMASDELEQARMEERRKAMNDLIDAATDRKDRGGDVVVSFGMAVGPSYGWYITTTRTDTPSGATLEKRELHDGPGFSLPTGVAVDVLPERWFRGPFFWAFGFHAQLTAFDLSQYAVAPDGEALEPDGATAIVPGVQLGILLGDPDLNVIVGWGAGYAPRARFSERDRRGVFRHEIFAGIYVPFIDFN